MAKIAQYTVENLSPKHWREYFLIPFQTKIPFVNKYIRKWNQHNIDFILSDILAEQICIEIDKELLNKIKLHQTIN